MTTKGKSAKGLNPTNDTASRARKKARYAQPNVTVMNDHWRKAKEADPTLEFRMTFMQWKKEYMRQWDRKRKEIKKELGYSRIGANNV